MLPTFTVISLKKLVNDFEELIQSLSRIDVQVADTVATFNGVRHSVPMTHVLTKDQVNEIRTLVEGYREKGGSIVLSFTDQKYVSGRAGWLYEKCDD